MKMKPTNSCKCEKCASGCDHKPGWFAPGEVAEAAKLLGMEPQEFFEKYCSVDYWNGEVENSDGIPSILALSPALSHEPPGQMMGAYPLGRCALFEDGLCRIHEAKPSECAHDHHDGPTDGSWNQKREIARLWVDQQGEVLGYKPDALHPSELDVEGQLLWGLGGMLGILERFAGVLEGPDELGR